MRNHVSYYGLNRYLCNVLDDMRTVLKNKPIEHTKDILLSLVEEAQVLGNRMEAGLEDKKDLEMLHNDIKMSKEKYYKLQEDIKKMKEELDIEDED